MIKAKHDLTSFLWTQASHHTNWLFADCATPAACRRLAGQHQLPSVPMHCSTVCTAEKWAGGSTGGATTHECPWARKDVQRSSAPKVCIISGGDGRKWPSHPQNGSKIGKIYPYAPAFKRYPHGARSPRCFFSTFFGPISAAWISVDVFPVSSPLPNSTWYRL